MPIKRELAKYIRVYSYNEMLSSSLKDYIDILIGVKSAYHICKFLKITKSILL